MSLTFDSAAETVQCRAVLAGSAPAASRPAQRHLPAAWLPPGSPALDAADLQATQKHANRDKRSYPLDPSACAVHITSTGRHYAKSLPRQVISKTCNE